MRDLPDDTGRGFVSARIDSVPAIADTAREGVANAVEAAGGTRPHAPDLLHAAQQSFVDGWQQAMWAGALLMGALFLHIAPRGPENTPSAAADETDPAEAVPAG